MFDKHRMTNWLAPFLKKAGMSQEELAERNGVSRITINRLAQDHSKLKVGKAAELAAILGCSADDLMQGGISVPAQNQIKFDAKNSGVTIPDLAIFGGMGNGGALDVTQSEDGTFADPDQVRGYWSFPDYMVRGLGNLKHIYAWEVRGDSMEPTLAGGAVVFVDTTQTSLPPDDIYAVDYGDGLVVKRIKLIPRSEKLLVISDNPHYGQDELRRDEVRVYGRIKGWFQWRG